tara:strand:+ start:789 stop:1307 length:519 start_codon:yes stop_codon:yes gene_type:complete
MPTLYESEVDKYGYGLSFNDTCIELHPKGMPNEVWLEIQHSEYDTHSILFKPIPLKNFKLIRHRNIEYTKKYAGRYVSKSWVIGYCKHNQKTAKKRSSEHEELMEITYEKREQEKLLEEKARKQSRENAERIHKTQKKKTGYHKGAELCPKCGGDALRNCNYCDSTGWVGFE